MTAGFQTQVNVQPAPAVEGDFASTNPRATVLAGPGGLVAGASGVYAGRFAWVTSTSDDADGAGATVNSFGTGSVSGFVHRNQQGLITTFLADASMLVPQGFPVVLYSLGDFWVKNNGLTQAVPGMTAYANFADGKATFAAAGAPAGATASAWGIAATTALSCTGSISGNILTVTAVGSGNVYPGTIITNAGASIAAGTYVVSQLTSTAALGALNTTGTYAVSIPEQTIASGTITGTSGTLTLTTVTAGTFGVGDTLTGAQAGVTASTFISYGPLTGAGGSGSTFIVNNTQSSGQGAQGVLTGATNVATKWTAMSSGLAGELVKISAYPLG